MDRKNATNTNTNTNHIYINKENSTTKISYYKDVPVIKYNIFDKYDDLVHGFSTRLGGCSTDHLSSLNLSFSREQSRDNVLENHKRFAKTVGYDEKRLVFSDQLHNTNIKIVTEEDCGKGIVKESDIVDTDGLITNVKNIPLITFYADCVPNYFYDPVKKVVGVAHSGWRGTVQKIGTLMIGKMSEVYGSNPEDIICAIGPSICKKCYEVSLDVADEFKSSYSEDEYNEIILAKENDKFDLDLHLACKFNLLNAGVLEENIAMPDLCTCCNSEFLYSHRASMGKRGNLAAVIMLR